MDEAISLIEGSLVKIASPCFAVLYARLAMTGLFRHCEATNKPNPRTRMYEVIMRELKTNPCTFLILGHIEKTRTFFQYAATEAISFIQGSLVKIASPCFVALYARLAMTGLFHHWFLGSYHFRLAPPTKKTKTFYIKYRCFYIMSIKSF